MMGHVEENIEDDMVGYFFLQITYKYGCLHIHSYISSRPSFQDFHPISKNMELLNFCKTNCSCKEPGHILRFARVPHEDLVRIH